MDASVGVGLWEKGKRVKAKQWLLSALLELENTSTHHT